MCMLDMDVGYVCWKWMVMLVMIQGGGGCSMVWNQWALMMTTMVQVGEVAFCCLVQTGAIMEEGMRGFEEE